MNKCLRLLLMAHGLLGRYCEAHKIGMSLNRLTLKGVYVVHLACLQLVFARTRVSQILYYGAIWWLLVVTWIAQVFDDARLLRRLNLYP
jgi:hypothetical protein